MKESLSIFFKALKITVAIILALCLAWIFIIGQPMKLVEGIVQVVKCGWDSEVENGFTCDK